MHSPIRLSDSPAFCIDHGSRSAHVVTEPPLRNRCDGWTVGVSELTVPPPHRGERHSDGDEILYVCDGAIDLTLELDDCDQLQTISEGEAFIVPAGIWHRVTPNPRARVIYITPGPTQQHRPQ